LTGRRRRSLIERVSAEIALGGCEPSLVGRDASDSGDGEPDTVRARPRRISRLNEEIRLVTKRLATPSSKGGARRAGPTSGSRRTATVASVCLLAAFALTSPAGAGAAKRHAIRAADATSVTKTYVETFYPRWFTYYQSGLVPRNELIGPDRISPIYQIVVAINDDTLYASAFLDLTSGQPMILTVPSTTASYSVLNLDAFGNVFDSGLPSNSPGSTLPTRVYALVPPGYAGPIPAGATRIQIPYTFSVLIFRADKFLPNGDDLTQEASQFRASLKLQTLSNYLNDPSAGAANIVPEIYTAVAFKSAADFQARFAPIRFDTQIQTAVHAADTPPLTPQEQAASKAFDSLFGSGGSNLTRATRLAAIRGTRAAHTALVNNYLDHRGPNNWIHFTNMGNWGNNVLDRASSNEFIQYGNGIKTAAYYHTFVDGRGAALTGSHRSGYVLTFPKGGQPPAGRFWSLTAYTPQSIELIPNAAKKYVVASYTPGLKTNRNGSVSIYISRRRPRGVRAANWLPVWNRAFNVMLRVYGVKAGSSVANNTYVPPPVVRRLR
jgi:hypothetical protein